jgi:hypothetical protein
MAMGRDGGTVGARGVESPEGSMDERSDLSVLAARTSRKSRAIAESSRARLVDAGALASVSTDEDEFDDRGRSLDVPFARVAGVWRAACGVQWPGGRGCRSRCRERLALGAKHLGKSARAVCDKIPDWFPCRNL